MERVQRVAIPWAIESGSRAWGFPSPDSDYDCRFVFVRPRDDYLSPWPRRDVIERPIDGILDVSGWDLGKAIKLLLKGNAVVIEWLRSPIVYRGCAEFRDDLLALAERHVHRESIARHYLHLGEGQRQSHFGEGKTVKLKKIFYALRPASALRWLRLNPDHAVAPMHFPTLIAESEPPEEVKALVAELTRRKATTRELGAAPLPDVIARFIDEEFAQARMAFASRAAPASELGRHEAEQIFRKWVERASTT